MSADSLRRVWVTGVGLVSPFGSNREASWSELLAGQSAVDKNRATCPLSTSDPRVLGLALQATQEALQDAELSHDMQRENWGSWVSTTKPFYFGDEWVSPDHLSHSLARTFSLGGPVVNVSAACATGAQSVALAARRVSTGEVDVALAGAAESSFHPLYEAGFRQMGVLSQSGCVRPFDRRRDGFIMGEGAAVFVLESESRARARGVRPWGEILSWNLSTDPLHTTRLHGDGQFLGQCLSRALQRTGLSPESVDYVNAHGTATPLNDRWESHALHNVFGSHPVAVSSTKGATGHLLGATGAVELGFTLLSLRDQRLPPTINLDDPETDQLDFVPNRSRPARVRRAASLSFGFGGALASVVVGSPNQ